MAKPQLYKIMNLSNQLYKMIGDNEQLEDWMESKISVLADDIGEVYDRLKHEKDKPNQDNSNQDKKTVLFDRLSEDYLSSYGKEEPSLESFSSYMAEKHPKYKDKLPIGHVYDYAINKHWDNTMADREELPENIPNCFQINAIKIAEHEYSKACNEIISESKGYSLIESEEFDTITLKDGVIPLEIYQHQLAESLRGGKIVLEAVFQGKKVELNKPKRGGSKKFYVYVSSGKKDKDGKLKAKKVSFGDPNMEIKRDDKDRRSNFRKRHKCATAKDKTKARYWSCRFWSGKNVSDLTK